jgi:hypothetical protein
MGDPPRRRGLSGVANLLVARARTQLETTQEQATDIAMQRAQFEHAIAVLIESPCGLLPASNAA